MARPTLPDNFKNRPRGRPFEKKKTGLNLMEEEKKSIEHPVEEKILPEFFDEKKFVGEDPKFNIELKENSEQPSLENCLRPPVIKELLESKKFTDENGNKIELKFFQTAHRGFRLRIYLNDVIEIKSMTFNGATMAWGYWELLKNNIK